MKKIIYLIVVCFILSSCASYSGGRLPSIDVESFANNLDQDGLKVGVQFYDAQESKKLFGIGCVADNYQTVYIVIDNRSNNSYDFKKRTINKTSAPAEEVADKCKFNTAGRAAGYGVAGLIIWPLLIPAVVDGTGSAKANDRMEDDFMYKEIKDGRVAPNGVLNGIVFFDKMKDGEELVIRLSNLDTEEIKLFSFKK
jgi:hypothetical protein